MDDKNLRKRIADYSNILSSVRKIETFIRNVKAVGERKPSYKGFPIPLQANTLKSINDFIITSAQSELVSLTSQMASIDDREIVNP